MTRTVKVSAILKRGVAGLPAINTLSPADRAQLYAHVADAGRARWTR